MTANELQNYLHTYIPLTKAMQVTVLAAENEQLILQAPLAPNINPHQTVFGGSVATLATLAAWSLVHSRLVREGLESSVVVRRTQLEYELPTAGDFSARAIVDNAAWSHFKEQLVAKGKAKIPMLSMIEYNGVITTRFNGEFFAIRQSNH